MGLLRAASRGHPGPRLLRSPRPGGRSGSSTSDPEEVGQRLWDLCSLTARGLGAPAVTGRVASAHSGGAAKPRVSDAEKRVSSQEERGDAAGPGGELGSSCMQLGSRLLPWGWSEQTGASGTRWPPGHSPHPAAGGYGQVRWDPALHSPLPRARLFWLAPHLLCLRPLAAWCCSFPFSPGHPPRPGPGCVPNPRALAPRALSVSRCTERRPWLQAQTFP